MPENPFAGDDEFRVPGVWTPEEAAAGPQYVTRKEFAQYVAALNQHGVMAVNSTEDAPHPEMAIRSVRVGAGALTGNPDGFVFAGEPVGGIINFTEDPRSPTGISTFLPRVALDTAFSRFVHDASLAIKAYNETGNPDMEFFIGSGGSGGGGDTAVMGMYEPNANSPTIFMGVESSQGYVRFYSGGSLIASAVFASSSFGIDMPLALTGVASDPTPSDGWVWYRSDLDKYRVRANGVTYNLAVEAGPQILGSFSELTIASGVITVTTSAHTVDTEADAGTDDLDTINGGTNGQILVLQAIDGAHTVVCKDFTGNLLLAGDFSMDSSSDTITLIRNGSFWRELCRSDNGA